MADDSKYPTRIAPYGLRIPPDLKERVQSAADRNNRSMNMEIVAALEEAFPSGGEIDVNTVMKKALACGEPALTRSATLCDYHLNSG